MKQLKKGLFTLLVGVFGMLAVNAQTNLFENGDFQNGTTGWRLGGFSLAGDSSYRYLQTGYIDQYGAARVATDGQEIAIAPGQTYVFSFWGSGLEVGDMTANFKLKDADGNDIYNIQGIEGVNYNTFKFEKAEEQSGWVLFERSITFPSDSKVAKLVQFGITLSDKSYKKVAEISMIKKESPAPKNFKVKDNSLSQRVVAFSWDAVNGKAYRIRVNGEENIVEAGHNTYVLHGLKPNTKYTAEIYTKDAPQDKSMIEFTTKNYIKENEEERVPFLANIEDSKIDGKFIPQIEDLTGVVVDQIEVTFNDTPATVEGGYVMLPDNITEGKLVVKVIQANKEETVLTYNSITKK